MIKFFKMFPKIHLTYNYNLFFWGNQPFLDIICEIKNMVLFIIFNFFTKKWLILLFHMMIIDINFFDGKNIKTFNRKSSCERNFRF